MVTEIIICSLIIAYMVGCILATSSDFAYMPVNLAVVCPHCQTSGNVRVKRLRQKTGISGGRATGAVLTGGLSLLVTGLSRKQWVTHAHCDYCYTDWQF